MRIKVSLLLPVLALGYLTRTLRLPVRGWTPTGTEDGVGPLTVRQYWLDVEEARCPGPELAHEVLQQLPTFFPPLLASFRRVRQTGGPTAPGDLFAILMVGLRRGRVKVAEVSPGRFLLQTLRQHSESGSLEFRVDPVTLHRSEGYRLTVVSRMRSSSWFDRVAYLMGMGILQRLTWETGLRRAFRRSGGRKVSHGTTTQEWP